jgi:DtxR family Mn-dependent transcriptional regulator
MHARREHVRDPNDPGRFLEKKDMDGTPEEKTPQLAPGLENYLEAIFRLQSRDGAARASSIAEMIQVTRSAVTVTLKTLKSMGYVEYSPYSLIYLTEKGMAVGRQIAHRHFVLQSFLEKMLLLDAEDSDKTACAMEHVVPAHVIRRLGQFVLFLKSRPDFWANWPELYEKEQIFQDMHTQATIEEVLGKKRRSS